MKSRVLSKVIEYLITFLVILTVNFLIPRLMPGDPFTFLSTEDGGVAVSHSQEQIELYKSYYGLDKPLGIQYVDYLKNMVKGNIGYSIYYKTSVMDVIGKRMLWTIGIVISAIGISFIIGTFLGCISAWYRDHLFDDILYFIMITVSEIPSFLVGVIFLFTIAAQSDFFPISGGMKAFAVYSSPMEKAIDIINHAILPVITLSMVRLGRFYLLARNSMITVLSKDYITTARAKGLAKQRIIFRHAMKNAFLPIVTRLYLSLGAVFGGAILVENVFNYPGIGRLMREAVMLRDYVLIQGIFLFITILVLSMNLMSDFVYGILDPRVRGEKAL